LSATGCDVETAEPEAAAERGPLGKADLAGSCAATGGGDFCGEQSPDGCYCDDACSDFGDCCSDAADLCGAEPQAAQCVINEDCGTQEYCLSEGCGTVGECKPIPTNAFCGQAITTFCDCDGNTQTNLNTCIFAPIAHLGPCEEQGPATCQINEDCGPQEFCESEGCGTVGECKPIPGNMVCGQAITPFCDCDGNTQFNSNTCIFGPIEHLGRCES
jgi:hypothetical protein